jgi:hypothetical protein
LQGAGVELEIMRCEWNVGNTEFHSAERRGTIQCVALLPVSAENMKNVRGVSLPFSSTPSVMNSKQPSVADPEGPIQDKLLTMCIMPSSFLHIRCLDTHTTAISFLLTSPIIKYGSSNLGFIIRRVGVQPCIDIVLQRLSCINAMQMCKFFIEMVRIMR